MEETVSAELKLSELSREKFRHTIDQLHDRASSILSLTLQWKEIEDHFNSVHNSIEQRVDELRSIRESAERKLEETMKRENDLELVKDSVNARIREVEAREKEFELIQKQEIQEQKIHVEWIESSRKELHAVREELEKKNNEVSERLNELEVKEKEFDEKNKHLELENRKLMERIEELELKEKEIKENGLIDRHFTYVKIEPYNTYVVTDNVKDDGVMDGNGNVLLCVTMDGKALQIYLNEQCENLDLLRNEVFVALGLSSNPGKLVLDAMQGFYPPRGDLEFAEVVIRKTCIFLLEMLMEMKPEIVADMKEQALILCLEWMKKMKTDVEHSIEILGCLQLLASYELASFFAVDKLLGYLEIVAHDSKAPQLLRNLGLTDRVSGFIENLITKNKYFEAIRFIYAFQLVNKFPIIPLLDSFMKDNTGAITKIRMRGKSIEERIDATSKMIDNMKAACRCIEDYKIEYKQITKCLERQILCLEKANISRKGMLPALELESQPITHKEKEIRFTSKVIAAAVCGLAPKSESTRSPAVTSPRTISTIPHAPAQSQKRSGNKRPWSAVSAEDDQYANVVSAPAVTSFQMPSHQPVESSADQEFIQGLIKGNQRLEAIKYIYQLKMVDKFPPGKLLRDHLSYMDKKACKLSKKKNISITAHIGSLANEIAGLGAVINCIATYSLENEFSSENLKERVAELEKKMAEKKQEVERSTTKTEPLARSKKKNKKKNCSSTAAPSAPVKVTSPAPAAPVKVTSPAPNISLDPLNTGLSPPSVTASSVAASINVTFSTSATPKATTCSSSQSPITVSTAAPTTQAPSPSPIGASTSAPTTVATPAPKVATSVATGQMNKKPKLETKKQKQVFKKGRPQTIESLGRPLNSSIRAAYYHRPAGQFMHHSAPSNTPPIYQCFGDYSTSNSQFNLYDNHINPFDHFYAHMPSSSGYFRAMPSWRPY